MIVMDRAELCNPCAPATLKEGWEIVDKLDEVLSDASAGIGLAANQIGFDRRVCILRIPVQDGPEQYIAGYNFINPHITKRENPIVVKNEGCLSFPGETVQTLRYYQITVKDDLEPSGRQLNGWAAICCQHEVDHLDGVTMHSRITHKLLPNQACPCESGKKFKKCCMKELRVNPLILE